MARFFPMFLRLAGRIVVVVGGGGLAVRTVEALLACDAEVRVITRTPSSALRRLHAPNLTLIDRALEHGDLEDALLAIAVDEDPAVNLQAARQGLEWNVLVSIADELALSDFVVPAFVHRGGLTLALHAGTVSKTLSHRIGEDLERGLSPEYGDFIGILERARERIGVEVADPEVRETLFERLVRSDLLDVVRTRGVAAAEAQIDRILAASRGSNPRPARTMDGSSPTAREA